MKVRKSQSGAIRIQGTSGSRSKTRHSVPILPPSASGYDSNRSAVYLLVVAAILAGVWVVMTIKSHRAEQAMAVDLRNEKQRQQIEASVNRNIQLTNRKIETDKEQIRVEAGFVVPRVGMVVDRSKDEQAHLDLSSDRNEMNVVRDLDRSNERGPPSASDIVQAEVVNSQQMGAERERLQKEFAQRYIEEARRNGFDVKLGPDLRVIDVKPMGPPAGNPSNPLDVRPAGDGAYR
jgi:hypothetical protein